MNKLSDDTERKFIETFDLDEWEVESDSGWVSISSISKTVEYQIWEIETESGKILKCADTHIIFTENHEEIYAKDCIPNKTKIYTKDGLEIVTSVVQYNEYENMYDMEVDHQDHRFYTNDILSHNSITTIAYLIWVINFHSTQSVALLANKGITAKGLLKKLQESYEHIPLWMQQGVIEWNKHSLELENGSKIVADSTSSSAGRSGSHNIVVLDEFAFVPTALADDFLKSIAPTISSGANTKLLVISTPQGHNMFYKMWTHAIEKINNFVPFEIHWSNVPGRDEKWKDAQVKLLGSQEAFDQEFNCEFLGAANTLISSAKLRQIAFVDPKFSSESFDMYEEPQPNHLYLIAVDTSRGLEQDYSAFVVVDITKSPYKVVAKYRNNEIDAVTYPNIINAAGKKYNDAFLFVEINDVGDQVAGILHYDLEYENLIQTTSKGRGGQVITAGHKKGSRLGIRTTLPMKIKGCSNLKTLIESDHLIIQDFDILSELTNFVAKGKTYKADTGNSDDLVMCLVIFGWLATTEFFKNITNSNYVREMFNKKREQIEEALLPFPKFDPDSCNLEGGGVEIDSEGNVWFSSTDDDHSW